MNLLLVCFNLLILWLYNQPGIVSGGLHMRTYPLVPEDSVVVYSNGQLVNQEPKEEWIACGFGNRIVFLEDGKGGCYGKEAVSIKRGTVNQISTTQERTVYVGSRLTVIDYQFIKNLNDVILEPCSREAAKAGSMAKATDLNLSVNATLLNKALHLIVRLGPGSKVTLNKEGLCCSCTSLGCGTEITAGITSDQAICYTGVGESLAIYANETDCPKGFKCLNGNPIGKDAYLPTSTTTDRGQVPIGVTFKTFMDWGLKSRPWLMFVELLSRVKRLIGTGLGAAAYIMVEALKSASEEGFAADDRNFEKIKGQMEIHDGYIYENLRSITMVALRNVQTDLSIRNLNQDSRRYQEIIMGLVEEVSNLSEFLLYMANYFSLTEEVKDDSLNYVREKQKSTYPNEIISKEIVMPRLVTFVTYEENILTGNCTYSYCDGTTCQLEGSYLHYQRTSVMANVENPYLTSTSCGIFVQTSNTDLKYAVLYSKTFEDALNNLKTSKAVRNFCFVQRAECLAPIDYTNYLYTETKKVLGSIGVKADMSAEQRYYIDCGFINQTNPDQPLNITDEVLMKAGIGCDTVYSSQELQRAVKNFKKMNFTLESARAAYLKNLGPDILGRIGDFFEDVGAGLGSAVKGLVNSILPVDILSIFNIILILSVVILYVGLFYLAKAHLSEKQINAKSREMIDA